MSDVDEMIYFEPRENPDGSLTVSTRCVKRRAQIERFTWTIHRDRTVTQESDYVDVLAEVRQDAITAANPCAPKRSRWWTLASLPLRAVRRLAGV